MLHHLDVAIATHEGGPRNGVLTAVEDFFATAEAEGWRQASILSLFGLTILWHAPSLTESQRQVFEDVANHLERIRPFLTILELNRVILHNMVLDAGQVWRKQKQRIAVLEAGQV